MNKLILTATLILLSTLSHAQVPNTFSSGETISSSQINANFSFLADAMARGNVTAIIYCNNGPVVIDADNPELTNDSVVFENPKLAFYDCLSTDNQTLPTINSTWCSANHYGFNSMYPNPSNIPYKTCYSIHEDKIDALTLDKIIEHKMIFGPTVNWFYRVIDE